jgi:hypothetical protein
MLAALAAAISVCIGMTLQIAGGVASRWPQ